MNINWVIALLSDVTTLNKVTNVTKDLNTNWFHFAKMINVVIRSLPDSYPEIFNNRGIELYLSRHIIQIKQLWDKHISVNTGNSVLIYFLQYRQLLMVQQLLPYGSITFITNLTEHDI